MPSQPTWIELSGLPRFLNEKTRGSAAWLVLLQLIQLDCSINSHPNTVELSIADLAIRTGLTAAEARKAALALRKTKCATMFLPDSDEEKALFKISTPLPTPLPHSANPVGIHRYCDCPGIAEAQPAPMNSVQDVVDLYFNFCSLHMNQFILDRLQLIATRHPYEEIRRTFIRAEKNNIRSLSFIERELTRMKQPKRKADEPPSLSQ